MKKTALIFGVTGQDGSYLTDFLLKKNYKVVGVKRRSSSFNTKRIDHIINSRIPIRNFKYVYGDLTDSSSYGRNLELCTGSRAFSYSVEDSQDWNGPS